jgi:hypothetical protein
MADSLPSDKWFYKVGDVKFGPVTLNDLRDRIIRREVPIDARAWRYGMEGYAPLREVGEVFPDGIIPVSLVRGDEVKSPVSRVRSEKVYRYGVAIAMLLLLLGVRLFMGGSSGPFAYEHVSGDVLYEDGQTIPAEGLSITFIPLVPPHNQHTYPRPGFASVDAKTGAFRSVTSKRSGDGLVKGTHKVLIADLNRQPLPPDVVPAEYAQFATTPLTIDTSSRRLQLRVARPKKVVPASKPTEPRQ